MDALEAWIGRLPNCAESAVREAFPRGSSGKRPATGQPQPKRMTDVVRLLELRGVASTHVPLVAPGFESIQRVAAVRLANGFTAVQVTRPQVAASARGARRSASTRPPSKASRRIL